MPGLAPGLRIPATRHGFNEDVRGYRYEQDGPLARESETTRVAREWRRIEDAGESMRFIAVMAALIGHGGRGGPPRWRLNKRTLL